MRRVRSACRPAWMAAGLLLACIAAAPAWAQAVRAQAVRFSDPRLIEETELPEPTILDAADVDGDGDQDLLVSTVGFRSIEWLPNDGTGVFGRPRRVAPLAPEVTRLTAADVDGDGAPDVLAAYGVSPRVSWFRNEGGGAFGAPQVIAEARFADLDLGDVDGDGDLDLLLTNLLEGGPVRLYANDGRGGFATPTELGMGHVGRLADLDGDGDLDVVTITRGVRAWTWRPNAGDGTFGAPRVVPSTSRLADPVHIADVDGDGRADVVAAVPFDYPLVWFRNDGGTFASDQLLADEGDIASLNVADFDGDGVDDVLAASMMRGTVAWFGWNAGRAAWARQPVSDAEWGFNRVIAADVNGDGAPDVATVTQGDNRVAWYPNDGTGRFRWARVAAATVRRVSHVEPTDLDGDGDLDVLAASEIDQRVAWFERVGTGFAPQVEIERDERLFLAATAADLDGDGAQEVLVPGNPDNELRVYRRRQDGGFWVWQSHTAALAGALVPVAVAAADLDGDGDPDVLTRTLESSVTWRENDGEGRLGPLRDLETGRLLEEEPDGGEKRGGSAAVTANGESESNVLLTTADLDGDGDLDVVTGSRLDGGVWSWFNQGRGTFQKTQLIWGGTPDDVHLADLDDDGDLDVMVSGDGTVVWRGNPGTGLFGAYQNLTEARGRDVAVDAGDVDGDGRTDVAFAVSGGRLVWRAIDGDDNVPVVTPFTDLQGARRVRLVDLDDDGDLDVLAGFQANFAARPITIAWFENLGAQDTAVDEPGVLPSAVALAPNHPNPFRGTTTLAFTLDRPQPVRLTVYDALGRRVRTLADGVHAAGRHTVRFDASGLPSGVYLYRLVTPQAVATRRLVVVR